MISRVDPCAGSRQALGIYQPPTIAYFSHCLDNLPVLCYTFICLMLLPHVSNVTVAALGCISQLKLHIPFQATIDSRTPFQWNSDHTYGTLYLCRRLIDRFSHRDVIHRHWTIARLASHVIGYKPFTCDGRCRVSTQDVIVASFAKGPQMRICRNAVNLPTIQSMVYRPATLHILTLTSAALIPPAASSIILRAVSRYAVVP